MTYCYCKTPLCNNPEKKLSDPSHFGIIEDKSKNELLIDEEGSGFYDDDEEGEYYDDYSDVTEVPDKVLEELEEEYRRRAEEENRKSQEILSDIDFIEEERIENKHHHNRHKPHENKHRHHKNNKNNYKEEQEVASVASRSALVPISIWVTATFLTYRTASN